MTENFEVIVGDNTFIDKSSFEFKEKRRYLEMMLDEILIKPVMTTEGNIYDPREIIRKSNEKQIKKEMENERESFKFMDKYFQVDKSAIDIVEDEKNFIQGEEDCRSSSMVVDNNRMMDVESQDNAGSTIPTNGKLKFKSSSMELDDYKLTVPVPSAPIEIDDMILPDHTIPIDANHMTQSKSGFKKVKKPRNLHTHDN